MKGFFKDIIGFNGAIIGTRYENATDEIKVDIEELKSVSDHGILRLDLTFANPKNVPFSSIQEVEIAEYKILDDDNKEIIKASLKNGTKGKVSDGKVLVNLIIPDAKLISGEEYTIVIEKMYGHSKADAPLSIIGKWVCRFVK